MTSAHSAGLALLPDWLQQYFDAYSAHASGTIRDLYTSDARVVIPGAVISGPDEVEAMWAAWFSAFPDVASEVLTVSGDKDLVFAEWEESGTHLGRLRFAGFNLPASGRRLCWRGGTIFRHRPDGIESATYYFDRLTPGLQLGTLRALPGMARSGWSLLRAARRDQR